MLDYGNYQSWVEVTKAFGKIIEKLPNNQPIRMWPIACAIIGDDFAKTLIKQFRNLGAIEVNDAKIPFQYQEYFVNIQAIEENMLD